MATKSRRIRTLLYGDERLNAGEVDLLHTPALQRLYDLHQLGLTDRIYIDASHSRLHHVVGVLEQTEHLVTAIVRNLQETPDRLFITADGRYLARAFAETVRDAKPVIRLIGLLHDLTHAPYGHTIEDEIQLVACKHDEPSRQSQAFYALVCQYLGWLALDAGVRPRGNASSRGPKTLEMPSDLWRYLRTPTSSPPPNIPEIALMAGSLLRDPSPGALAAWHRSGESHDIAELLAQLSCAMRALLYLDVLHAPTISEANCPDEKLYPFEDLIAQTLAEAGMGDVQKKYKFMKHRDAYMLDIIGNTVCADLLDYARRDAHFAGIKLGYDADRIAENFTLATWDLGKNGRRADDRTAKSSRALEDPFNGKSLRTAISLYSHKLRTDVIGELANLLNVRFYIYERMLFHPTKCAAGAMLGTALQLIGWRPLRKGEQLAAYELPNEFKNLGDAVFLHDVVGGANIALDVIEAERDAPTVRIAGCRPRLNGFVCSQTRVAELILERWDALPIPDAVENIRAGLELLSRVGARRFYQAVFRNLPNSKNKILRKKPEQLAQAFMDPIIRFRAEREIEAKARLRRGSVVIHCPRRITAQKVANVLLVLPTKNGAGEEVAKLRDVRELDPEVFGAHQEAILAVERMYESMWRLVVYVTPEALAQYPVVAASAGRVIFDTMDEDQSYPDDTKGWDNDKYLADELEQKYGDLQSQVVVEDAAAETAVADKFSGPSTQKEAEVLIESVAEVPVGRENVAAGGGEIVHAARQQRWIAMVRRVWRADLSGEMPKLVEFYDRELSEVPDEPLEKWLLRVESEYSSVPKNRKPSKIDDFLKLALKLLREGSGTLFNEG